LGFAKGNNVAIKFALKQGADYVFLLNNDTILEKDLIERLIKVARTNNKIGIVGPKILDIRNQSLVHEVGMTCDIFGFPIAVRQQESGKQTISEVFYVSGCAMLIKQEVLNKAGLFDEEYFMFAENYDLHNRLLKHGFKIGHVESKEIHTDEPRSLLDNAKKHYYYGKTVKRFLDVNPEKGIKQISPIRPAFIRNWKNFAKHPLLAIGFFIYQIVRYSAAGLGFLSSLGETI
jgi:GT2 family glycosyltransferase